MGSTIANLDDVVPDADLMAEACDHDPPERTDPVGDVMKAGGEYPPQRAVVLASTIEFEAYELVLPILLGGRCTTLISPWWLLWIEFCRLLSFSISFIFLISSPISPPAIDISSALRSSRKMCWE